MKKTFMTGLRTFCAGALALLAVSCYDDAKLWSEVEGLDGRVTELETRVTTLEQKLNSEVSTINNLISALKTDVKTNTDAIAGLSEKDTELLAAIQGLQSGVDGAVATATQSITDLYSKLDAADKEIDGYVADLTAAIAALQATDKELAAADADIIAQLAAVGVTKVAKNEAGNVVLTFLDGSTIEVPKYDPNVNNAGLVTVVEEEGVQYWGVILEDGTTKNLGVEVGHVELQFAVDSESLSLNYSVDGGATWNATGAYVAVDQAYLLTDFYQGDTDEYDWSTYEYIKEDFYTLVFGGVEYNLPLYKVDNSTAAIKSGKTYFAYGESQTIDVVLSDVTSCYVMTKPDGWRAKLNGKKLTVTAPSEAAIEAGIAEADGEVLLHCTTTEGNCKVAKLAVSTTGGFKLTVSEDGTVEIVNPFVTTTIDPYFGDEITDFRDAYIGLAPIADFEKDPVAYVENCPDNYSDIIFMINNWKEYNKDWDTGEYLLGGKYVAGEYEVDYITSSVADIYAFYEYSELPRGSQYVVWAAPIDDKGMPVADELVYDYYAPVDIAVKETISFNDVAVSVELYGADSYLVGKVQKDYAVDYMTGQQGLDIYIMNALQNMAWGNSLGMIVSENGEYSYNLSEVISEYEESAKLSPDTEYYFFIIPLTDGKAWTDYEYSEIEPFTYLYTTEDIVYDASCAAEVDVTYTASASSIQFEIASTSASIVYYDWFSPEDLEALTETEISERLFTEGYVNNSALISDRKTNCDPETEYVLAIVVVDEEGKYGDPVMETISTAPIPYTDVISAELTALDNSNLRSVSATFAVTGDVDYVVCYPASNENMADSFVSYLLQNSVNYYYFKKGAVADGVATVTGMNCSYSPYVYYVAYAEDEDGNMSFTKPQFVNVNEWGTAAE